MGKVWMPVVYSTFVEDQTHNDTYLLITLGGTQLEIGSDPTFDGKTVNLPSDLRLCRLTDDAAAVDMQLIAAAAERLTLSDLEMERDLGYRLLAMVAKMQEANNE